MTITTLPADTVTGRLARKLAETTGMPLPLIVKQAIEAEAAKAGISASAGASREELLALMIKITDGFATVLDQRSADEIIGYDENGVSR